MKLIRLFLPAVIFTFALFLLPESVFASSLYLSPGSATISTGGTISVNVRLNAGGEAVNAVSAFLSYPADKLEVAGIGYGGSAFGVQAESSYGGGVVKISRGSFSPVSGDTNIASITFRGKSPGLATVSFIGGSAAPRASDSSDSLNLGGSRGGVYTVGGGAVSPQKSSTPATRDKSKPAAQSVISDIIVTNISKTNATITWKTNTRSDSLVEYGLEKDKYFLSSSNGKLVTEHTVTLENAFLTPGVNLHFRIKSKDDSGQETIGEDQELQLLGYTVKIKVTDNLGNPISGVKVLLYSYPKETTTNSGGEALFENISPGKHLVVIKAGMLDKTMDIEVQGKGETKSDAEVFNIKVSSSSLNKSELFGRENFIAFAASLVIFGCIVLFSRFLSKKKPSV